MQWRKDEKKKTLKKNNELLAHYIQLLWKRNSTQQQQQMHCQFIVVGFMFITSTNNISWGVLFLETSKFHIYTYI